MVILAGELRKMETPSGPIYSAINVRLHHLHEDIIRIIRKRIAITIQEETIIMHLTLPATPRAIESGPFLVRTLSFSSTFAWLLIEEYPECFVSEMTDLFRWWDIPKSDKMVNVVLAYSTIT